jgi:hypothetical protein
MPASDRGRALTIFAILFGALAVSNFLKPLHLGGDHTGFVFLGQRLTGTPNMIIGPLFGLLLAAYAAGIWRLRRYALSLGYAYAAYVIVNLVMFQIRGPKPPGAGAGYMLFGLVYATIAIGVSSGAAYLLHQRRDLLS